MSKNESVSWPRIGCGCILLSHKHPGKALYGLRKGSHGAGKWALPGGKLDLDEDALEACIQREIEEEVGIILPLENIKFVALSNDPRLDGDVNKHFVTCLFKAIIPDDAVVQNLEPHKCEGWEWTSYEQLLEYERQGSLFVPMVHLLETNAVDKTFWARDVIWTKSLWKQILDFLLKHVYNPLTVCLVLLILEVCICHLIVCKVPYTEIDWKAYMQEVEGYLSGVRNYELIRGDTGPLVYPAGFLYIFSLLYKVTDSGLDISRGQIIFAVLYLLNLTIVLCLYQRQWAAKQKYLSLTNPWRRLESYFSSETVNYTRKMPSAVPLWGWGLLTLSRRVHSLFVLRMFNDCVAVFCGYVALWLFTLPFADTNDKSILWQYRWGCAVYSLGVGVKMNMLLWAPGLLLVLLLALGIRESIVCLGICALIQLALGFPFLASYPLQYLNKAFELGRVFEYRWSVNFKFLSERVFVSPYLSVGLLLCTVLAMVLFARKWLHASKAALIAMSSTPELLDEKGTSITSSQRQRKQNSKGTINRRGKSRERKPMVQAPTDLTIRPALFTWHIPCNIHGTRTLTTSFILVTILTSNFIGIAFSRTLHYQFYCWYYHSLPLLLWHAFSDTFDAFQGLGIGLSVIILLVIEVSFNVYPATSASSLALQASHIILLLGLYFAPVPAAFKEPDSVHDKAK